MNVAEPAAAPDTTVQEQAGVLLVNDDPGALFALRAVLSDLDADIVTAASGEQALMRLLKQDFCVILLDVKMTGIDGFETARLVRSRPRSRDTPIIFLTSHRATDIDRAKGYALGAADYLFMPVAPEVLKAKVQAFLDNGQARRRQHGEHARGAPARALGRQLQHVTSLNEALRSEACARQDAESLAQRAETERLIVEHAGQYVALLDSTGTWLYASPSYQAEFGVAAEPGASYLDIVHAEDRERVRAALVLGGLGGTHKRLQYRVLGRTEHYFESDSNLVREPSGAVAQLVIVSRDITERKQMEAYVLHQSFHDALTGLPNRLLLLDRLCQATAHRARLHAQVALLFIDLDHFKEINDTLGHAAGDRLLQDVAERLIACVGEGDTVARLGADQFVVMVVGLRQVEDAALLAENIIAAVSAACRIEGSELRVSPSIGITVFPEDGADPDTLLRNADIAMAHAKHAGGARYCFFAPQMQEAASRKLALGAALQRAIATGEFVMHYQPKVDAFSGKITGFEALIRWPQADGSAIPPGLFIPVAEETGRIDPIGAFAVAEATGLLRQWRALGIEDVPIAVNVSPMQFRRETMAADLAQAAAAAGVLPGLLEVELTESGVMSNPAQAIETLHQIHALGMTIAIDDFGTGYSSLAYLKRFPIDKLKIDASFVRDIATDPSDAAIVLAIITLAHVLNLTVIAEGVETAAQMEFLIANGCDELQGNYFSAAVSEDEALVLLRRGPFSMLAPPTGTTT